MCFLIQGPTNLQGFSSYFNAIPDALEFDFFAKKGLEDAKNFKRMEVDGKIYPGSFAPVLTLDSGKRMLRPMRYRVRPAGSLEEVPSKFNVFNARRDSLLRRKTWQPLIGQKHGIFLMKQFYEWVKLPDGRKKLIHFYPTKHEQLLVPCLYDFWQDNSTGNHFYSFAVITDEPPQEVLDAGHDRCPINLKPEFIDKWLDTSVGESFDYYNEILGRGQLEFYAHQDDYISEKKSTTKNQMNLFDE